MSLSKSYAAPNKRRDRPLIGISAGLRLIPGAEGMTSYQSVDAHYVDAVMTTGGVPILIPVIDPASDKPLVNSLLGVIDGLLVTGGSDIHPAWYGADLDTRTRLADGPRDAFDLHLIKSALEREIPILAICRGMQVANVCLGGTLVQHLVGHNDQPDAEHVIKIEATSYLGNVIGSRETVGNSLHHQGIDKVAPRLKVSAWSADGVVEALELNDEPWFLGVQWHPERMIHNPHHAAIFKAFVGASHARGRAVHA